MSLKNNNIVRDVARRSVFPDISGLLDATVSFNQGDLLCLKAGLVQKATADADTVNHLGVAPCTIVSGKLESPYQGTAVDAAEAAGKVAGPVYGVEASFSLKVGDAFAPGDLVYLDITDPQTVTSVLPVGAAAIGVYTGRSVGAAAAGDKGDVHVGTQFPGGALAL